MGGGRAGAELEGGINEVLGLFDGRVGGVEVEFEYDEI